jgi:hypothetical protein
MILLSLRYFRELDALPSIEHLEFDQGDPAVNNPDIRVASRGLVAVGMAVSRHPPHRSVRAELLHTAPASGQTQRRRSGYG